METVDSKQTKSRNVRMKLPILGEEELDIDAELKKFETEQMAALGLEAGKEHWRDDNPKRSPASSAPTRRC